MNKQPSIIGGGAIIASVCVGAGMLGLPSVGAGAWFGWSSVAMVLTMVVMTLSGWMLLEAFKHYDLKVSFNTVTKDMLGDEVNILNNITVYFVGGILLYAYITSSGLILQELTGIESRITSILFVIVFSSFVWHSTRAVDRISLLLILFMLFSFVFGVSGLAIQINTNILFDTLTQHDSYFPYSLAMLPVALTSFGYHHSVSSMRAYYGEEKKAKYAILLGTSIALILYFLWLFTVFGNLPRAAFAPVIEQGGSVDSLLKALGSVIESEKVSAAINAFSMAAIFSSFIGVGLGLFDFLADLFKCHDTKKGRSKTWLLTFIPPLLLSLFFPFGFVIAIGYAGAAATVWTCIIPALLARKSRKLPNGDKGFIVGGGRFTIYFVLIFGLLTALFHILSMSGLLPIFKG